VFVRACVRVVRRR